MTIFGIPAGNIKSVFNFQVVRLPVWNMTCHSVDCGEPHTSIINEIAQAIEESQ